MTLGNAEALEAAHLEGFQESIASKPTDIGDSTYRTEVEFWNSRECLRHIADMARHRYTSPWSVLGVCLARTLTVIPPWITLPPIIGGRASLNLFVAVVAPSSIGKGASEAVAAELVPFDEMTNIGEVPAGSGEGLAHAYVRRATTGPEKGNIIRERTSCLFSVPEVDTLTEIGRRQGSTIMSKLRSAYSGEEIGFFYADPSKRLLVGKHEYRLCLTLGVQPERADALLSDAAGGTPQRFIWMPADDPSMLRGRGRDHGPIEFVPLREWGGVHRHVHVPDVAVSTILDAHVAKHRGSGDVLDGHALLTRLKVMVALAALDGRTDPTERDWSLAGDVMAKSRATRQKVTDAVAAARDAEAAHRGRSQGVARDAASVSAQERKLLRFQVRIARKIERQGGSATQREILHTFNGDDRTGGTFADALNDMALNEYVVAAAPVDGEAINQAITLTPQGREWLAENGSRKQ